MGQGSSLQVCVSDPGQGAPPFVAAVRTVLVCVPPPQVTLQGPNSPHTQSTGTENKKYLWKRWNEMQRKKFTVGKSRDDRIE